jgi:hypothetical protein
MSDPGDEHVDVPPPPIDKITQLLEEFDDPALAEGAFWAIADAEALRSCCRACALEANGEDGS